MTVSLQPDIVSLIDSRVAALPGTTRSGFVEQVLREWQSMDASHRLEEETAAYYDSLSDDEREEDDAWVRVSEHGAATTWGNDTR